MNKTDFGNQFKILRLKSGFETLEDLSVELEKDGLFIDASLLSHWQRGARLPHDRETLLALLKTFTKKGGVSSPGTANRLSQLAGMGFLTHEEMLQLFPTFHNYLSELVLQTPNQESWKIYFAASARGRATFSQQYEKIHTYLQRIGQVMIDDTIIGQAEPAFYTGQEKDRVGIYWKAVHFASVADLVVLEITVHSLSMGYVLHQALSQNKPVIALYTDETIPYFASFIDDKYLQVLHYDERNVKQVLSQAINFLKAREAFF